MKDTKLYKVITPFSDDEIKTKCNPIVKMILDIDYKIAHIQQKIFESSRTVMDFAIKFLNDYLKSQNQKQRYFTFGQKLSVSDPAIKKIDEIIAQDKKNLWGRQD